MGKVTVYCPLSGCSPEIPRAMWWYGSKEGQNIRNDPDEFWNKVGPLVREALFSLMSDDEKKGMDDIVVITAISKDDGEVVYGEEFELDREEIADYTESDVRVIPSRVDDDNWDFGSVEAVPIGSEQIEDPYFIVSYGVHLMVYTTALAILDLATNGRITPQRFWKTAMTLGRDYDSITGLEFGKEMEGAVGEQDPPVIPGMTDDEIVALEGLDDVEQIKKEIVHRGRFWIWMRPDRFPVQSDAKGSYEPSCLKTSTGQHPTSLVEGLPVEVLTNIASHIDLLETLMGLTMTSRQLRVKMLGTESDRDALARAWIYINAPWYIPRVVESGGERVGNDPKNDTTKNIHEVPTNDILTWAYLRRCLESGSMRNRRRIWGIAKQVEQKYDELQLK